MPMICRRGEDKMPAVGFLALLLFLLFLSLLWEEKLPPLTSLHYRENLGFLFFLFLIFLSPTFLDICITRKKISPESKVPLQEKWP